MKGPVHQLDEATRRQRQAAVGLRIQPIITDNPTEKKTDTMQEPTLSNASKPTRAEQVLRHLATTPTFKEVAVYELKKASIWAPIMMTTLVGALWVNKRFLVKAATGL